MRIIKFFVYLNLLFIFVLRTRSLNLNNTANAQDDNMMQLNKDYNNEAQNDITFLVTGGYRPKTNYLVKYIISLRRSNYYKYFGDNHFCAGAVISKKAILTAAHCLFNRFGDKIEASQLRVLAGTPQRLERVPTTQEMQVQKAIHHPRYRPELLLYDIGIIRLTEKLNIDSVSVDIIPLTETEPEPGTQCTIVGWGTVIQFGPLPDEAVYGDIVILSNSFCKRLAIFTFGMLCAANPDDYEIDSCQGDSGGPLICKEKVAGIVSFGYGCGEPNSPGIYTDVNFFKQWILDNSAFRNTAMSFWFCLLIYSIQL